MQVDFNIHKVLKDRISKKTYSCLEVLSLVSSCKDNANIELPEDLVKAKVLGESIITILKDKFKSSIYYIRLYTTIDSLLQEYDSYSDEFKKLIVDYYIFSNSIMEMNSIGLGWYYDVKYKKNNATLYSVGYGQESNWNEWLKKQYNEYNRIKERAIQLIFHACKEHINKGGNIRLKSLSKCFGVDLFKYMQLDRNDLANLYIIKDAPINFIEYDENIMALQEYILSPKYVEFDINNKPEFCIDFSVPRNQKNENYNNWSKKFLNEPIISKAELDNSKEEFSIQDDSFNDVLLMWLRNANTKNSDKAISSRISPVIDKEVIVSKGFWEIQEYSDIMDKKILLDKCYHFTFSETEYCQLIFRYFESYFENKFKGKGCFKNNYHKQLEKEENNILREIDKLNKENDKLMKQIVTLTNNDDIKRIEMKINQNKYTIDFWQAFISFLNKIDIEEKSQKVNFALSFIEWDIEDIPKKWSLDNIYTVKENKEKNLYINLAHHQNLCLPA